MFNIGSSVVNKTTLKHATVSNVMVSENVLESRGYDEPRVELQYSDGIRDRCSCETGASMQTFWKKNATLEQTPRQSIPVQNENCARHWEQVHGSQPVHWHIRK